MREALEELWEFVLEKTLPREREGLPARNRLLRGMAGGSDVDYYAADGEGMEGDVRDADRGAP